jgi:hypothetical protein
VGRGVRRWRSRLPNARRRGESELKKGDLPVLRAPVSECERTFTPVPCLARGFSTYPRKRGGRALSCGVCLWRVQLYSARKTPRRLEEVLPEGSAILQRSEPLGKVGTVFERFELSRPSRRAATRRACSASTSRRAIPAHSPEGL